MDLQEGQKILINYAAGGIGNFTLQFAKYFEAEVTTVDSTDKSAIPQSIVVNHVIDYAWQVFPWIAET